MTDDEDEDEEDEELSDVGWGLLGGLAYATWATLVKNRIRKATDER